MRTSAAVESLSALAGRQLGLFTRGDARSADVSDRQILRMVQQGIAQRVTSRVFRFAASTPSWNQDVLAACLDGGPECLASHRTAAALHGFDGFSPGIIEVLVPMHVRLRRTSVIVHHTRSLGEVDRAQVGLIPVTSKARTLIDLGAVLPAELVEEAFDGAERDRTVRRREVEARYRQLRARGRNGIGAMTQILEVRSGQRVPRSVLERRMLRLLRAEGLPAPIVGHRVRMPNGTRYEIDFAYVRQRLAVEVDGHGSHATRRQRAADNARANALGDTGWTIRRFTYEQVVHQPAVVARTVRSALANSA